MTPIKDQERSWNVLVYGLEKVDLNSPSEPIRTRNFTIHFEKYRTPRRFNEYDGVVVFQGIFEKFQWETNYLNQYLTHEYDQDELDKRKKEATLLLKKGGFLVFVLNSQFMDHGDGREFKRTDLAKYHLNYSQFYRENFDTRIAHVDSCVNEFKRFLDLYGAGYTKFTNHNRSLEMLPLARVSNSIVGMVLDRQEYFVPSLIPDNRPEVLIEYFELLVDAVTAVSNKLHQSIPEWVASYTFDEEPLLKAQRAKYVDEIERIDARLSELASHKAALVHTGPALVQDVSAVLSAALGVTVDTEDEFREDATLLDGERKPICVCEIKGINKGVGRENINQADSHRERSGYSEEFPALLIANTFIKSARTIEEKDQEIAKEQVRHAVKMRVLVMRTIDLLGLLRLVLANSISREDARLMVLSNIGWLRVVGNEAVVISGEDVR